MGLTYIDVKIRKDDHASTSETAEFLVDSGAVMTVAPGEMLQRLGIEPKGEHKFTLANGEQIVRKVGEAYFEIREQSGYSKVIFGQPGDSNLLGALTLEACLMVLDPIRRELKPLPMLLM